MKKEIEMTILKQAEIVPIQPMRAEINRLHPEINTKGDCATWAILLASRESKIDLSYPTVVEDIIRLKAEHKSIYPYLDKGWLEGHAGLQPELAKILLEKYLGEPFIQMIVTGKYSLGLLADHLHEIPVSLIGSYGHVTTTAAGKIYDDGKTPRGYRAIYLLVREKDALKSLSILRKLGLEYPVPDLFPKRSLTFSEERSLEHAQKLLDRSEFYRAAIWGMKAFQGIVALNDLQIFVRQEMLDKDFVWTSDADEFLMRVIKNLEKMGIIEFKKQNPSRGRRSIIAQTDLTISLFHRLKFD